MADPAGGQAAEAIQIGKLFGGISRANSEWESELRWLTKAVRGATRGLDVGVRIGIQMQVAGPLLVPDFDGVRWGRYSSRDRTLVVQVALAETPPANVRLNLLALVSDGIDEASRWAASRNREIDFAPLKRAINRIDPQAAVDS